MKQVRVMCDVCGAMDINNTKNYEIPKGWFSGWIQLMDGGNSKDEEFETCSYLCMEKWFAQTYLTQISTLENEGDV